MARSLNPNEGGSDPRNSETTGELRQLQQYAVSSAEEKKDLPDSGKATFVGVGPHSNRSEILKTANQTKIGNGAAASTHAAETPEKVNKLQREIADGLLLVVPTRIYGHSVRTLIDSGATRCFITPACVARAGLKVTPQDLFLELGNGQKYLSRGCVTEIPIATAGLTVKMDMTVTSLLHDVDLVLGMNWLQLVNPVVDKGNARMYIPNAVQTALLQGDWLER